MRTNGGSLHHRTHRSESCNDPQHVADDQNCGGKAAEKGRGEGGEVGEERTGKRATWGLECVAVRVRRVVVRDL